MIAVSIISHNHGSMLPSLVNRLLEFSEVEKIIVTLNTFEKINLPANERIFLIQNQVPRGFGANHNHAFSICKSSYFCVLNPDITFSNNPFPGLIQSALPSDIGLVAPMIKNLGGGDEDSVRRFPSPLSILRRRLFGHQDGYRFSEGDANFYPEWVGGMCMLFKSSSYAAIKGFDDGYFLYVEDVDICTRLWKSGYKVLVCPSVVVFHEARRASRRNWQHLRWHIAGLLRYFMKYLGRLPRVS